jgi:flavin reductase (DIM6/NTAB) family NADH-FMN oxidoreductase RutF
MSNLKHIAKIDFDSMARFYRANLINSITGYKPANLIGTFSENGVANLAIFTSVVHLGANPALMGFIQRPVGEYSHTYKNIKKNLYYTINHVHEQFIEKAHFTSAKFDENISEFDACKLTAENLNNFKAPFVKESEIKIGLKFVEEIKINLNNTILMIGHIEHLYMNPDIILPDGNINLNSVNDVCVSGLETYHKVKQIEKFSYAKKANLPEFE